jgi:hypothetical protein
MLKVGDLVTSKLTKVEPKKEEPPAKKDGKKSDNPPPKPRGFIEKTDGKGRVTISVGSEAGVTKGQVLEAYRLKPGPWYLGQIRIVEVTPKKAVAEVVWLTGTALEVGDRVATVLLPHETPRIPEAFVLSAPLPPGPATTPSYSLPLPNYYWAPFQGLPAQKK